MDDISQIYNREFFNFTKYHEIDSSLNCCKIIQKYLNPNSVIDLGCGSGIYLKSFQDIGIKDLMGYDGSIFALTTSMLSDNVFIHDLREPLKLDRKFDLALSIEVAEHIEEEYSEILVESLCRLSDKIFFTAAIPNQGGYYHINEKHHDYWIKIFNKYGFTLNEEMTNSMRQEMKEKDVVWWISNNLMVFRKRG